uniref:Uncharacterized protein n=1 Tax=Arundo donax TaxID=35708 RepID=A0A0A9DEN6_ARUDO
MLGSDKSHITTRVMGTFGYSFFIFFEEIFFFFLTDPYLFIISSTLHCFFAIIQGV